MKVTIANANDPQPILKAVSGNLGEHVLVLVISAETDHDLEKLRKALLSILSPEAAMPDELYRRFLTAQGLQDNDGSRTKFAEASEVLVWSARLSERTTNCVYNGFCSMKWDTEAEAIAERRSINLAQVCTRSAAELLKITNLGKKSLLEVCQWAESHGCRIAGAEERLKKRAQVEVSAEKAELLGEAKMLRIPGAHSRWHLDTLRTSIAHHRQNQ